MKNCIHVKITKSWFYISYVPLSPVTMKLRHLKKATKLKDGRIRCKKTRTNRIILNSLDAKIPNPKTKELPKEKVNIDFSFLPKHLELRPFQKEGVVFLEEKKKVLLADEMGLGKTIQVLGWMGYKQDNVGNILIVCPAIAKLNWYKEIQKWLRKEAYVCEGMSPSPISRDYNIVIVNYRILTKWQETIKQWGFKVIVADEAHRLKNYKTKQAESFRFLARYKPYKFMLSGTPVVNRPIEFYNILAMLRPGEFGDYWKFVNTYCDPINKNGYMDYKGSSNKTELHQLLTSTVMLRRLKKDVLPELPPKQLSIQYIPLTNRNQYDKLEEKRWDKDSIPPTFEELRQVCLELKMKGIYEWIDEFLHTGKSLILFGWHVKFLRAIHKRYSCSVIYYGSSGKKQRVKAVEDFQDGNKQLFLGNFKAAGEAITLTKASDVAFLELPWTPGAFDQASDRAHRIGQKDTVNVWCLMAERTIEETMYNMMLEKKEILDHILNGDKGYDEDNTLLTERNLMRKHYGKKLSI